MAAPAATSATVQTCSASLKGYGINQAMCTASKVNIDCSPAGHSASVSSFAAAAASFDEIAPKGSSRACKRNIYLDMGANWCNTLNLYESVPEVKLGWAHAGSPWHIFAVEAAPLIAPYVEQCTLNLAAGKPLPQPLVPPAGSSMQLLNYAGDLGCAKAGGRRERIACISKALDKPLAALARTADPSLTANKQLLAARLKGARTRGGCTGKGGGGGGGGGAAAAEKKQSLLQQHGAGGRVAASGNTYTMIPAAAGASEGVLRMAGSPLQMLRGGTTAAGSNHQPQFDVPTIDVVSWMQRAFTVDDFVVLKMDVEGAEIDIVPKLLATNATRLVDVFLWECHAKWRGPKGKCQCAGWEEDLRKAGVRQVYREPYRFTVAEKLRAAKWSLNATTETAAPAASRAR